MRLADAVRKAAAQSRSRLLGKYRSLIGQGTEQDATALLGVAGALGRTPEEVERDAGLLAEHVRLQQAAADLPEARKAAETTGRAVEAYQAETARLMRQREEELTRLAAPLPAARERLRQAQDAADRLRAFEREHAELLGIDSEPEAPRKPQHREPRPMNFNVQKPFVPTVETPIGKGRARSRG